MKEGIANSVGRGHWSAAPARVASPFVLYALLAALVLGANPFKGETITPFDILVSQRAWSFVDPDVEVRSYQRADILNALLPQWTAARKQIHDGRVPLWNDNVAGGGPLLSLQTNLFTPAFVIFAATPDPALGFYLAMLFNLTIAGLGMHLLLRRHVVLLAAIVGAVTFEFCGFNAAWLYWPHVATLIWAPWLLWAIDRCAHKPGMGNSLLVACATALTWLGGFPFLSVLVTEMAGLYALLLLLAQWRDGQFPWRFAGWCLSGAVLGLLLAALPILGLWQWLQQYDLGYREGRGSYLGIEHWKQLLPPWAYRDPQVEETMYVGICMLGLAAVATVAGLVRWRRVTPFGLFGALVVATSAGLVFALWPMWLIGWLPGMSANSWSRAIGLLDIGLVILGAIGLDLLWRACRGRGRPLRWALLAIGLVQVVEVALFFRIFNGPVDASYYFPRTPTIEYVRKHAGPFDYVIADKSFVMSGTLGVYGQREWLAHYFRSPALQEALRGMSKDPFYTHLGSASRFRADAIKYASMTMADYNVRFALIDSRYRPGLSESPPARPKEPQHPLAPMPAHHYIQEFKLADATRLVGVSVRLATYRRSSLPGRVRLTILNSHGQRVAQGSIAAAHVLDNEYASIPLIHPTELPAGHYSFSLAYKPGDQAQPQLTAWAVETPRPKSQLKIDGEPHAATIQYRLLVDVADDDAFDRVFFAAGITVLENSNSPGGPYFVAKLADHAGADSSRQVQLVDYHPDAFKLRYQGQADGYVVVPMTINTYWQVTVDGAAVTPELKDGVMPAVPVDAPTTIHFKYNSPALRWLLPWLIAVGAALLAMICVSRWTAKSDQ